MKSRQDQVRELAAVASSPLSTRQVESHDSPAPDTDFAFDVAQIPPTSHHVTFSLEAILPRKKLIFSSTVVKDSSGASVLAASAMSQRIPPCSVPIGLACCGPLSTSPLLSRRQSPQIRTR